MLRGFVGVFLGLETLSEFVYFLALAEVDVSSLTQLLGKHIAFALLGGVASLSRLQLERDLLQVSLLGVMVAARLGELLEELDLVVLLDVVQLAELVELGD